MKRKVPDKYRTDVKMGTVAPLPEEIQPMTEGIHTLIQSVYDDSVLKDMFTDGHETKVKENPLNDNFAKDEFQALWKQINHRYAYTVEFDSDELISKSIAHINEKLFVSQSAKRVFYGFISIFWTYFPKFRKIAYGNFKRFKIGCIFVDCSDDC